MPGVKEARATLVETVGDTAMADALLPQAMANYKIVAIDREEQVRAWSAGAVVVNKLIKPSDRRAINDQLWRYCASPDAYPLQLRTVFGGSDHPHSAEVLDWALPSLAIAWAMQQHKISPRVAVHSADRAAIELNGSPETETALQAELTLQLIELIAARYYPDVELETSRLSWQELTATPYDQDTAALRDRKVGDPTIKILDGLEEMVRQREGRVDSVAGYLALHNTAYDIYGGLPVVKLAGVSEARFNIVQSELASRHSDSVASLNMNSTPVFVAGAIQNTSSVAPYYDRQGISVPTALEIIDGSECPFSRLAELHGLSTVVGRVASLVAA